MKPKLRKRRRKHVKGRIYMRYSLPATDEDVREITKLIEDGYGRFVEHTSNTRSVYVVNHNDTDLMVVYHRKHKCLVTALPGNAREWGRVNA